MRRPPHPTRHHTATPAPTSHAGSPLVTATLILAPWALILVAALAVARPDRAAVVIVLIAVIVAVAAAAAGLALAARDEDQS